MITKVYQLKYKRRASFYTTYCGIGINLDFMHNVTDDDRAQLIVTNKFVQDAIEHDSRFGTEFTLVDTYGEEEPKTEEITSTASTTSEKKPTKRAPKKVIVSDVTNINDAYDYFAAHGVVLTTLDELKAQIAKENVEFPNVTL